MTCDRDKLEGTGPLAVPDTKSGDGASNSMTTPRKSCCAVNAQPPVQSATNAEARMMPFMAPNDVVSGCAATKHQETRNVPCAVRLTT